MSTNDGAQPIYVNVGTVSLEGDLGLTSHSPGVVLFAHGSGSSRFSPRNRYVSDMLRAAGLATLLMDLLTAEEEAVDMSTRHHRFNIGMLSERLIGAVDWLGQNERTRG